MRLLLGVLLMISATFNAIASTALNVIVGENGKKPFLPSSPVQSLMTIQSAITGFNLLEIKYNSLNKNITKRTIEPFAIYSTQGNWLLIAFCRLRKEFRVFRIDLIQELKLENTTFEPHNMSLERYFEICKEKYQNTPDTPLS